ncbi:hypothetical protein GOP47_0021374 [Adiantum capillus-veneris]|uniref:DNA-directed primase/polymerase protein n=1 Tax=Adiantum capillus-veneris TaxID=13818 RepID=A0A9D4Z6W4_ADICA|nr:hypothetical protein GOP47_0021374 [Adiantum capillus-veneris]
MESEDPMVVADRLLHCLHRGLSPRVKSSLASRSPKTPLRKAASDSGHDYKEIYFADEFVTPDLKNLTSNSLTKEVSPGVFYGSPVGKCSKRPPQVLRLLHEIRRDLASEGYYTSRNAIWATFGKQDQAMQFVQSHGSKDLALFVYQDHFSGQRRFLATTYKEFWCRYELIPQDHRHHYEIITEGSPCHLYFDLEFDRKANGGLDGNVLVDLLLSQIAEALHNIYSLEYDPSWTVELDSTTEEKFSRHVIIRVPNVAFKDNSHVGAFVTELCSRLDRQRQSDEDISRLYVLKGQSRQDCRSQLFLDQAVYSRNRSFRLPFSSKAGKTARLIPTGRFSCESMSEREVYECSLICRVGAECEKFLTFGSEVKKMAGCAGSLAAGTMAEINASGRLSKHAEFCSSGKSPFPEVDKFIESIACIDGIPGVIRSWYWFSEYGVLVYNMIGNRFCENIGRQHKSNHVMYIVDFRTAGYYQKCHDPDCRGFKSPLRPIPLQTIPASFPLSLPLKDCHANAEKAIAYLGHEECSAGFLSRLCITSDSQVVDHDHFSTDLVLRGNREDEGASMDYSEQRQRSILDEKAFCAEEFPMDDDDWWIAAQQDLEMHVMERYGKRLV